MNVAALGTGVGVASWRGHVARVDGVGAAEHAHQAFQTLRHSLNILRRFSPAVPDAGTPSALWATHGRPHPAMADLVSRQAVRASERPVPPSADRLPGLHEAQEQLETQNIVDAGLSEQPWPRNPRLGRWPVDGARPRSPTPPAGQPDHRPTRAPPRPARDLGRLVRRSRSGRPSAVARAQGQPRRGPRIGRAPIPPA